jgi:glycosyltransferase involved in cell wall biosynthesis
MNVSVEAAVRPAPSTLRVCLVSPAPPPYGGIANWTQMILKHAQSRSDVTVELLDTAPRWRSIHDTAAWKRSIGGAVQLVRDLGRFAWVLLRRRPDAVHLTTSGDLAVVRDIAVILAARLFATPVIYHIRFGRIPVLAESLSREWHLIHWAMRKAATVVAIDSATAETIRRRAPEVRVCSIPNCITGEFRATRERTASIPLTVMYLGWVVPTKGIGELIEAWRQLNPDGWRLVVAGPGDAAYCREQQAACSGADVRFVGELSHETAMRALAAADVFVLPSHTEGFPNAVLEAMAHGKAVVASEVGAIPEMLSDGCGILVRPRDVNGLADALRRITGDETLRQVCGQRAQQKALSRYHIAHVFEQYVSVWRSTHRLSFGD